MIRRWFLILIVANLLFTGLFIYDEWRPPWKQHHARHKSMKIQVLAEEIRLAVHRRDDSGQNLDELRQALREEKTRLQQPENMKRIRRLSEAMDEAQERLDEAIDRYHKNFSRYQLLEIRYHQKRDGDSGKEKLGEELRKFKLRLDAMKEQQEHIQLEVDTMEAEWENLTGERERLQAAIRQAEAEVTRLETALASVARKRPLIRQVTSPALGRVDRCQTCHLGSDDHYFTGAPQPLTFHGNLAQIDVFRHHPLQEYGCSICHDGQGLATTLPEAHGVESHFHYPLLQGDLVQGSCLPCHPEPIPVPGAPVLEAAPLLERGRQLFADKGCTGCHDAGGFEQLSKTGPDLRGAAGKLKPDWLHRWLKNPTTYLPRTHMPDFLLPAEEVADLRDYLLLKMTGIPARPAPPVPADPDEAYDRGRGIFQVSRCITCHALEGKGGTIGPDLYRVESKVTRDWLYHWLENPASYDPLTPMPRFRFTTAERLDLVEYITQEFMDWDLPDKPVPEQIAPPVDRRANRGEALARKYGCSGCHEMGGTNGQQKVSTDLSDYGAKAVGLLDFGWSWDVPRTRLDWTLTKLRTPRIFRDTLLMPDYRLSEEEIRALVGLLLAFKGRSVPASYIHRPAPRPVIPRNGRFADLVDDCRCLSCHTLGDEGGDLAPDLTFIGSRMKPAYLTEFLRKPEAIRPLLVERMIRLNLDDEELKVLTEGLLFLCRDDRIDGGRPDPGIGNAETGRQLYNSKFGCQACHMIGDAGGSSGPNLSEVGRRLRGGYLVAWLQSPQSLVPDAIEPDYGMSPEETADLAAFLVGLDGEKR